MEELDLKSRRPEKRILITEHYPEPENAFIKGLLYPGIVVKSLEDKIELPLLYPEKATYPSKLITFVHQEARIAVMYGEDRFQLNPDFYLKNLFPYKSGNKNLYQIGQHDFDQDEIPELVFGMHDGVNTKVAILRYHPPEFVHSARRRENWEQTFEERGTFAAHVSDQSIRFYHGGHGSYTEWTWLKDKFVQNVQW